MRSVKEIMRASAELDSNGVHIGGSDRESNHHYGDAYESLFEDRSAVRLMMEVGVADGSSLLAWNEVFPNALCVGMDIHAAVRLGWGEFRKGQPVTTEFHLGDQRSKEDCERAAAGRQFDLIVEDATHQLDSTLLTLLYLWPFVRQGGLYVVEEFSNIGALRKNVESLLGAFVVDTVGPSGGVEPLVALRKLL